MTKLREYELQNYNRPITVFYRSGDGGPSRDYILDPAYQRGSVWTLEQRQNLILSILQGLPIGALFLNDRDIANYAVVDGKQRIETLQMFAAGEFSISAEWVGMDGAKRVESNEDIAGAGLVTYGDLPESIRRRIDNFAVATYETRFRGTSVERYEQELELFNRVNFGGTPHETKAVA